MFWELHQGGDWGTYGGECVQGTCDPTGEHIHAAGADGVSQSGGAAGICCKHEEVRRQHARTRCKWVDWGLSRDSPWGYARACMLGYVCAVSGFHGRAYPTCPWACGVWHRGVGFAAVSRTMCFSMWGEGLAVVPKPCRMCHTVLAWGELSVPVIIRSHV